MSVKITVFNNGPYRIEGEIAIQDAEGKEYGLGGHTVVSLCRCGLSDKKPFCDGNHNRKGFVSQCQASELPPLTPKA
jgi:CDGSH-type Zn-finger protein